MVPTHGPALFALRVWLMWLMFVQSANISPFDSFYPRNFNPTEISLHTVYCEPSFYTNRKSLHNVVATSLLHKWIMHPPSIQTGSHYSPLTIWWPLPYCINGIACVHCAPSFYTNRKSGEPINNMVATSLLNSTVDPR